MTQFVTVAERPDLAERYSREAESFWPPHMEFVHHDRVCETFWPRLSREFPAFQFYVYDAERGRFLAQGNAVPIAWSGNDTDLPRGVPAVLTEVFGEVDKGVHPSVLCALLAGIQPGVRSTGLSTDLLLFMKDLAHRHGLRSLIAPVRPTSKDLYPLIPMERYCGWRRDDGRLFDPWLRTHERLGGRIAGIAREGNVFRGTVAEWERWTGLAMLESGEYVVRGAMSPVSIDREGDEGILTEQNVWMVHTVTG